MEISLGKKNAETPNYFSLSGRRAEQDLLFHL
jgi:hypothetical protein